ncbi:hypothetical protein B0H13DRAFT_1895791 [Mycena leptocephala]|nr:hypothetical protein B0H13DRAFT_1895791 [Mycena leptocephala]
MYNTNSVTKAYAICHRRGRRAQQGEYSISCATPRGSQETEGATESKAEYQNEDLRMETRERRKRDRSGGRMRGLICCVAVKAQKSERKSERKEIIEVLLGRGTDKTPHFISPKSAEEREATKEPNRGAHGRGLLASHGKQKRLRASRTRSGSGSIRRRAGAGDGGGQRRGGVWQQSIEGVQTYAQEASGVGGVGLSWGGRKQGKQDESGRHQGERELGSGANEKETPSPRSRGGRGNSERRVCMWGLSRLFPPADDELAASHWKEDRAGPFIILANGHESGSGSQRSSSEDGDERRGRSENEPDHPARLFNTRACIVTTTPPLSSPLAPSQLPPPSIQSQ